MDVNFLLEDIAEAASALMPHILKQRVVAFHGEMGAGKTTLVHAICDAFKVVSVVSSPTFSVINEYAYNIDSVIYHIDLYRLGSAEEAINAGVEDCLYTGEICLVEWPEKAPGIFPGNTLHCYLHSTGNNSRKLQIKL